MQQLYLFVFRYPFQPPCIAVSLDNKRYIKEMILENGVFAVTVLSKEQIDLAGKFGSKSGRNHDKFEGFTDYTTIDDLPIMNKCSAWMKCKVIGQMIIGDHTIISGEIVNYNFDNRDALEFNSDKIIVNQIKNIKSR